MTGMCACEGRSCGRGEREWAEWSLAFNLSLYGKKKDMDTRKAILLEEKLKRDSKKHAKPICAQAVLLKTFCILFLDTFKVYSTVSLVVKNNMQEEEKMAAE